MLLSRADHPALPYLLSTPLLTPELAHMKINRFFGSKKVAKHAVSEWQIFRTRHGTCRGIDRPVANCSFERGHICLEGQL